ncbi:MAG: PAS domain-containing protein [Mangrovicoccus sp.]|nr:PAS domain-containing protein [Mangrovicoccus sp.]
MELEPVAPGVPVDKVGEAEFRVAELFFSRTDQRGVIQAGNQVFTRVSGYDWSELDGAPHRLVRHADMPKAVFWLLWDRIKQGKPIGAYVKNATKTGGFYWVFAVVMPVKGGYLSVRLKPTSEMLCQVEQLYAARRAAEAADKLSPEASAQALTEEIKTLGFADYPAFMARALQAELTARDDAMGHKDPRLAAFAEMAKAIDTIAGEANQLHRDFQKMKQIPVNLRLAASRCEASGGPISVISANYSDIAEEALGQALRFTSFATDVLHQIHRGLFLTGAARLQREMVALFRDEAGDADQGTHKMNAEMEGLATHSKRCEEAAKEAEKNVADQALRFTDDCRNMRRFISSLDVTRVTCLIETRWQSDRGQSFMSIIDRLDDFHESAETHLHKIDVLNDRILFLTDRLLGRE